MKMPRFVKEIKVGLDVGQEILPVGRLAIRDQVIYFEYESSFRKREVNISPFKLPLQSGVMTFDSLFEGLPGVFNDSLPDGWGRLLFDRFARSQGILPEDISPLDRLAHVGLNGMGALVYEPDLSDEEESHAISLDQLADQAQDVLDGSAEDVIQELLILNGSSAGARPKALIGVDAERKNIIHGVHQLPKSHEHWLVKFPNTQDGSDAGAIEYVYALMAKQAGIHMPDVHLFPSKKSAGYFAIKRFDHDGVKRVHMHTAAGLLHSNFRTPSLDYEDLIALTVHLTHDVRESEDLYRLAVFNVLAHNRDDHAKNFSFLMNEQGVWTLSPAYDLTFSSGPGGEQSTMVMGEGRNPTVKDLIQLGVEAKISTKRIEEIINQTTSALSEWQKLAKTHGVNKSTIKIISDRLGERT